MLLKHNEWRDILALEQAEQPLVDVAQIAAAKALAKVQVTKFELTEADVSRVIEMAWEDRTAFEAIYIQFGLNQDGVIKLMRQHLKLGSFKLWRERTHGQTTKHLKLRSSAVTRHKANHRVKQF